MKFKKLLATLAVGFAAAGSAFALPSATTLWTSGVQNTLSDDFVEILIEPGAQNGLIDVGDILFTALGITSYAPNPGAASSVKELTLLAAIQVTSSVALPNGACGLLSAAPNSCRLFEFGAVTAIPGGFASLLALNGISLTNPDGLSLGAKSVAVVMEGDVHNFNTAGTLATTFGGAADGNLRAVLDLEVANGDQWVATGPNSLALFALQEVGVGIGSFALDLTISDQAFAGWDIGTQLTGRGNLSRAPATSSSPAGGDASFFFTPQSVPEPGSMALVALGLLGLGVAQRRKAALGK